MTAASDGHNLVGLCFQSKNAKPADDALRRTKPRIRPFKLLNNWLMAYFNGLDTPKPPMALIGTHFQIAVWDRLLRVPYGQSIAYWDLATDLAAMLGLTAMSAQAVSKAVNRNPMAILVPCHRVLGRSQDLAFQPEDASKKGALLNLEGMNGWQANA
jgi:methylated-DNA-[protein]-cysteine S-methyltransferase